MEVEEKLKILGGSVTEDPGDRDGGSNPVVGEGLNPRESGDAPSGGISCGASKGLGIYSAQMPGGKTMKLARILQTNICTRTCHYCALRCGRKINRVTFKPEELAKTYYIMHRRGWAEGLFLTSAIPGDPPKMMDRLLETCEILRHKLHYRGYLHLKILPGSEPAQIERAIELASRVSLNLEAPTDGSLREIAPEKDLSKDLLPRLTYAGEYRLKAREEIFNQICSVATPVATKVSAKRWFAPSGITTQFVVGASGEKDEDILNLLKGLYGRKILHHAHFSAFQPVLDTPLDDHPSTPSLRGAHLYQVDHLIRDYGFQFDEIVTNEEGDLPLEMDPKYAWALSHPERFPVEMITASYEELLRVPGIGPTGAKRLLANKRRLVIRDIEDLKGLGITVKRAQGFITWKGKSFIPPLLKGDKGGFFSKPACSPRFTGEAGRSGRGDKWVFSTSFSYSRITNHQLPITDVDQLSFFTPPSPPPLDTSVSPGAFR